MELHDDERSSARRLHFLGNTLFFSVCFVFFVV